MRLDFFRLTRREIASAGLRAGVAVAGLKLFEWYAAATGKELVEAAREYTVETFIAAVILTGLLFWCRKRYRATYGCIELIGAVLALWVFVTRPIPSSLFEWIAGFAAPIYIAIRGLDNLDQAAQARRRAG